MSLLELMCLGNMKSVLFVLFFVLFNVGLEVLNLLPAVIYFFLALDVQ